MTKQEDINLLLQFIANERMEFKTELTGSWYAMNWHRLEGAIKKAHRLLDEPELKELYYHTLRHDVLPGKEVQKTYPLLEAAYRDQLPFLNKNKYNYLYTRLEAMQGLFLFGFNHQHQIAIEQDAETYLALRAAWLKLSTYVSIPGIWSKREKLRLFAEDETVITRIEQILTALRFYHHPEATEEGYKEEWYPRTYLPFWGFITLLKIAGSPLIDRFKEASYLPRYREQMEILDKLV